MREGQVYRTAEVNREPRTDKNTCCLVPIPFLLPTMLVATAPKAYGCSLPIPGEQRVLEPFNLAEHFGMRKNDNKVVMSRAPIYATGVCQSCDHIDK
jgi:hypothetical protein